MLASFPEVTQVVTPGRPARRRHRHHRLLQHRVLRRSEAEGAVAARLPPEQGRADRRHGPRARRRFPARSGTSRSPSPTTWKRPSAASRAQLAIKIYGDDLKTLEAKGDEIVNVMRTVPGIADLGLFRVIGQPNLDFAVDREQGRALRHQRRRRAGRHRDRGRRQGRQPGAAGRAALRPGGALPAAVSRHQGSHREHPPAGALGRARFAGAALHASNVLDGASEIYREGNSRYVAIKYSVPRPRPGQHGGRGHAQSGPAR